MAAFRRELQLQLHKVHLLCLLARGLLLSRQCEDHTLQAVLLSVVLSTDRSDVRRLAMDDPSNCGKIALLKLVRWFSKESSCLRTALRGARLELGVPETLEEAWQDVGVVSEAQLLMSLLLSLGLRSRLVMVLHPLPLRTTPLRAKGEATKKGKGRGKVEEGVASGDDQGGGGRGKEVGFGERLLQYNLKKGLLDDVRGSEGGGGGGGGGGKVEGGGKGKGKGKGGGRGMGRGWKGKGKRIAVKEEDTASPYFTTTDSLPDDGTATAAAAGVRKKQRVSVRCKKSTSSQQQVTNVRQKREEGRKEGEKEEEEESDDDFVVSGKRKKSKPARATPSKKLKRAMTESQDKTGQSSPSLPAVPIPSTSSSSSSLQVGGPLLAAEVEMVVTEETGSWVEVYSSSHKKWWCIHTPSCSVDQPQLCEKYYPLPLHYVLAFEKGKSAIL